MVVVIVDGSRFPSTKYNHYKKVHLGIPSCNPCSILESMLHVHLVCTHPPNHKAGTHVVRSIHSRALAPVKSSPTPPTYAHLSLTLQPHLTSPTMLEIACFNASSAISAAKAGADRIELCADYAAGGITPSLSTLHAVRKETSIPINVMIRPREGDFNYTDPEFRQMKEDIRVFSALASGFVFGVLDESQDVDGPRNSELVALAAPLPCTFHRAIDKVGDLGEGVEKVVKCGFGSVLTSGGRESAWNGVGCVEGLQERFKGRIEIILGGGVRSANVAAMKRRSGVEWVHSAAITEPGEEVDESEVRRIQDVLAKIK